jgi:hypothetical protein
MSLVQLRYVQHVSLHKMFLESRLFEHFLHHTTRFRPSSSRTVETDVLPLSWLRSPLHVYPIGMDRSPCCVVSVCCPVFLLCYVSLRGPVYALVYLIVTVVLSVALCVSTWPRLCPSVSHSDGRSFCCAMCLYVVPSMR